MIDEVGRNIPLFESYNVRKHLRSQVNVNGLKRRKNILRGGLSSLSNYVEKAAFTTICFTSLSMVGVLSCVPVILFGGVWGFFSFPRMMYRFMMNPRNERDEPVELSERQKDEIMNFMIFFSPLVAVCGIGFGAYNFLRQHVNWLWNQFFDLVAEGVANNLKNM